MTLKRYLHFSVLFLILCQIPSCSSHKEAPKNDKTAEVKSESSPSETVPTLERTYTVVLYFQSINGPWLIPENREVTAGDETTLAKAILQELIKGPSTDNLVPTVPRETRVSSVLLDARRHWIYVDFDRTLVDQHPGGSESEIITVYSIVNSLLANMKAYRRVWILIQNQSRQVFKYHVFIGQPLPYNPQWIARKTS